MSPLSYSLFASTALSFLAAAALADLSAQDVWSSLKTNAAEFGYDVNGDETPTQNGLIIDDLHVKWKYVEALTDFSFERVVLTEHSDGTVSMALPARISMHSNAADSTKLSLDVLQTGLKITASGDPEAIQYEYTAEEIALNSADIDFNGRTLSEEGVNFDAAIEDLSGRLNFEQIDPSRFESSWQADVLRFQLDVKDQTANLSLDTSGQVRDFSVSGSGVLPDGGIDLGELNAALLAGYAGKNSFRFETSAFNFFLDDPDGKTEMSMVGGMGESEVSLDKNGAIIEGKQNDFQGDFSHSQLPLPIHFSTAESNFNLSFPLIASETFENFGLGFALNGLVISDTLWNLFDPSGQLPRDPATVAFDLNGEAKPLIDFFDPYLAETLKTVRRLVEVKNLKINRLDVSAAGAELTGKGAFEFDNAQFGPPKPAGSIDLALSGGNGLIDTLVAIGVLPEQQAMGARLMMGLLTIPGEAPDTMSTKIEINKEGHVIANGQRIQ
ncbi:MAG: DUF2125 domain-containing protein [Roseobacter sp.]